MTTVNPYTPPVADVNAPAASRTARGRLRYPDHLVPPLMARRYATAFAAAVEGSGGRNPTLELCSHGATESEYSVIWS